MSYFIKMNNGDWTIPEIKQESAFLALKELDKKTELNRLDPEDFQAATTLQELMEVLGFTMNRAGQIIGFTGQKYDERIPVIFKILAPYSTNKSWISFTGEEDETWNYYVLDRAFYEVEE